MARRGGRNGVPRVGRGSSRGRGRGRPSGDTRPDLGVTAEAQLDHERKGDGALEEPEHNVPPHGLATQGPTPAVLTAREERARRRAERPSPPPRRTRRRVVEVDTQSNNLQTNEVDGRSVDEGSQFLESSTGCEQRHGKWYSPAHVELYSWRYRANGGDPVQGACACSRNE